MTKAVGSSVIPIECGEIRSLHGGPIRSSEGKYAREANLVVALNDELDDKRESFQSRKVKSVFLGAIGELLAIAGGVLSFLRLGESAFKYTLAIAASGLAIRVAAGYAEDSLAAELTEIDRTVESAVRKALKENTLSPRENYQLYLSRVSAQQELEKRFPKRYEEYLETEIEALKEMQEELGQLQVEMTKEMRQITDAEEGFKKFEKQFLKAYIDGPLKNMISDCKKELKESQEELAQEKKRVVSSR